MDIRRFLVARDATLRRTIEQIDANTKGIALVVDDEGRLLATVTDGDVRRAILARLDLDGPLSELLSTPALHLRAEPVSAQPGTPAGQLIHLMTEAEVRHLPLVDAEGRVVDLVLLDDLVREYELPLTAVVMAGGFGTRLMPLTEDLPKPMLPVAGRPLLEHIIDQLRVCGIRRVSLTTHYKAGVIADHFGDGDGFGVDIDYLEEGTPLGTAGALSLLQEGTEPLLVMNGDILTKVDFRAMLDFHREQGAAMTVAVRLEEIQLPYGVVSTDGVHVRGIEEKPTLRHFINAGIYLLSPEVRRHVPDGIRFDMTQLVERLIADGEPVVSFPIREYWLDIGHATTYEQASRDVEAGKLAS